MKNKTDLSVYTTGNFEVGAGILKRLLWYFINILFFMNPLNLISSLKVLLLKIFGAKIGKGVNIKPAVNIKYPWKLTIGDYSWIGEKAWIDNLSDVKIGSNCCISQGAMLLSGNHNFTKTSFDLMVKEIILEDGAWIGAHSIVCPGVICRSHSVLTVNSVATKNMDEYSIYQGNPAKKVKDREIL
ncbi:MAG: WcaF family extracellular polysaccharide biosynthesis acetyltransferase [Bacteroidales bacterium]|nr:WcaF family extracellular polysaccharide biosynthesis acetyltransferase [Bacteroidales bacterium]